MTTQKESERIARKAKLETLKLAEPKIPKKLKLLNVAIYFVIGLMTLAAVVMVFWLVYPYKTADIIEPITILNPNHQVAPGEIIKMQLHITKYNSYPVQGTNSVLCTNPARVYVLVVPGGTRSPSLPPGKFDRTVSTYALALDAVPGSTCTFEFRNSYQVNPIRAVIKQWASEPFTVN